MKSNQTLNKVFATCCLILTGFGFYYFTETSLESLSLSVSSSNGKVFVKRDDPNGFEFRIYSNNVRVDTAADKRFPDERGWTERKYGVIEAIQSQYDTYPTLIGVQEAKYGQLVDIKWGINNGSYDYPYTHYGVGRDDGNTAGEYAAIIYNTEEWNLINGTYKWLSPTPDVPGDGPAWGADTRRIITFTTFQHKQSGKFVNYLNTHFDQKSALARQNSASLVDGWVNAIPNDYPTFLSGDFNSWATDIAYQSISTTLKDSNVVAYNHYGSSPYTYTGFEPTDPQSVIDFIFSPLDSNTDYGNVIAIGHEVVSNLYNGFLFSDHRPISTHFKLKN